MIITTEITKTVIDTDKVEALVRELLDERFGDEFVFDPIEVHARIFDDGIDVEDYLEIYVVFDGDPKRLPASWTGGLAVHGARHDGDGMRARHLQGVLLKGRVETSPEREGEK